MKVRVSSSKHVLNAIREQLHLSIHVSFLILQHFSSQHIHSLISLPHLQGHLKIPLSSSPWVGGPTYNCPSTTSGSSTTLQSNCPYLPPKSTKTISPTSTSSSVLALNSAISCAISSLDGSLWRWVSEAAQRQL